MTHFDHERIPERIVHARGAGAHGHFQAYSNAAALSQAAFLQDPSVQTGVVTTSGALSNAAAREFIGAMEKHRHWDRM